jgi:hypothetical protein
LWTAGYPSAVPKGKPTVCMHRKAAALRAPWQALRAPPGSKNGACLHRGDSGTWESHRLPGKASRKRRDTGSTSALARACGFQPSASRVRHTKEGSRPGSGEPAASEATREGPVAVVVEHSTAGLRAHGADREGGGPRPKGPTAGQAPPGRTRRWEERWEKRRAHHPSPRNSRGWHSRRINLQRWRARRWRT